MENFELIIRLISTVISILALIFSIKAYKETSKLKSLLGGVDDTKEKINEDELMNSLEFNTYLDGEIQTMLGAYSNDDIVTSISKKVMNTYHSTSFSPTKLSNYIRDVLSMYNNPYNPDMEEEIDSNTYTIEENDSISMRTSNNVDFKSVTNLSGTKSTNANTIDIMNSLTNFYND